jgi:hypothetical protein
MSKSQNRIHLLTKVGLGPLHVVTVVFGIMTDKTAVMLAISVSTVVMAAVWVSDS